MASLARQSNLVTQASVAALSVTPATINGVAAGNCLVAIVVVNTPTGADANLCTGYSTTVGGSPGNTWTNVLRQRRVNAGGVWYSEVTAWVALNVSAGNTVGTPTFAYDNLYVYHHMDEWSGVATASAVDRTATAFADAGATTITVGPTSTLSQASELVIAVMGNGFNDNWNGSGTAPGTAPSGYTVVRGNIGTGRNNAQTVYREVGATTAQSATWAINSTYGPSVAGIFTLKLGSTSLRLEVDNIDPEIASTSGWTFWAWPGDPLDSAASKRWTSYGATVASGKLIFPDAPSGAALDSVWNVMGYQPSGSLTTGFMTGVVRAAD